MSPFTERLHEVVDRWAERLPAHLARQFREDFLPLGVEHEDALDRIEAIWRRQQRQDLFDESTGLARRRPFQAYLAALLSRSSTSFDDAVGVLFIDVDNLKAINDTCGHAAGDRALAAVGRILRDALRVDGPDVVMKADSDDYSVARHGGDEFLVAVELHDAGHLEVIAPRVKARVDSSDEQRARGYDFPVRLSCSLGGVVYELPRERPPAPAHALARDLIRLADEQMYHAKGDGLVHVVTARFTDRLEADEAGARTVQSVSPSL